MTFRRLIILTLTLLVAVSAAFAEGKGEQAPSEPKIFTYAVDYDPPSIDPQKNYAGLGELIASNLHVGLVTTNERMEPVPAVAEKWEISPDGKTYTFFLRKNSKWSDGTPLTAKDFYYSWLRLLDPDTGSKYVTMAFSIVNAEAIYNGEAAPATLGVKVIDDYTIRIQLTGPLPYMLQNLAHGAFMPMRESVVSADPEGWAVNPETNIGNGPFKLKAYAMNDRVILEKNPYYYDADKVHLDELHFVTIPEGSTALAAYQAGEIDGFSYIPNSEVPRLMAETDELYLSPQVRSLQMYLNTQAAPLDNPRVREALSRALDREEIAKVMGLGRIPATGYVPVGLFVEGEDFREAGGDLGLSTKADPERAKAALAAAGYPGGKGLPTITVTMSSGYRRTVEAAQEMWKKNLGIDVEIEVVESRVLADRRRSGDFQISMGGWSAAVFHPIYFLDQLYSSGGSNYPKYENPAYDALITRAKSEPNPKTVIQILHQAEQMGLGDDFALLPLYYETSRVMIKDYVTGWFSDPIGRYHFRYVDIEK